MNMYSLYLANETGQYIESCFPHIELQTWHKSHVFANLFFFMFFLNFIVATEDLHVSAMAQT